MFKRLCASTEINSHRGERRTPIHRPVLVGAAIACATLFWVATASTPLSAQARVAKPMPGEPVLLETADYTIRVTAITGISHPWSLAFLPNGDILVTERNAGRLRIIRDGALDPHPISGVPAVSRARFAGLMEVVLHPRFAENGYIYLTYIRDLDSLTHTPVLIRARLNSTALVDVQELFVANHAFNGPAAGAPMVFGSDGYLYLGIGGALDEAAQRLDSHAGKILRLRDDGSVPPDNPFVGQPGHLPEIWSRGHRNMLGLTVHPQTAEIWESENGPLGGDEINIVAKGANYGWPLVSYGRNYDGSKVSESPYRKGMAAPHVVWIPSIAPSGLTFYTGDRFANWRGNVFVGGLQLGGMPGSGQLQRIILRDGEEWRREALLVELRQRIRNVRQGPDGLLYVLTDEPEGALLKIEPVNHR